MNTLLDDWKPTIRITLRPQESPATQCSLFDATAAQETCNHDGANLEPQARFDGLLDMLCSRCGGIAVDSLGDETCEACHGRGLHAEGCSEV